MASTAEHDPKQVQDSTAKQGQTPGPSPHSPYLNKMLIHPRVNERMSSTWPSDAILGGRELS